jgi:hypothetical protein
MDAERRTANTHLDRIAGERKKLEAEQEALDKRLRRLNDSSKLWAYVAEHGHAPPEIGYGPDEEER